MHSDKSAIVTGGAGGLGAAMVRSLAAAGYAVVIHYHTQAEAAQALATGILQTGGRAAAFHADITVEDEAAALIAFATQSFGRLDVLVNNAGIAKGCSLDKIDTAHINDLTAVNIAGLLFASKHAARAFGNAGGSIINISSTNATSPVPGGAVYSATKAAVNAITISLARELGPRNIRVNAVAPGLTMTPAYDTAIPEDAKQHVIGQTPLGRLGLPEDIAGVVAFLASDAARWINGQVIAVSGGAV
jgi:3-oxoacyl-[acyl-carrier protein] reductase